MRRHHRHHRYIGLVVHEKFITRLYRSIDGRVKKSCKISTRQTITMRQMMVDDNAIGCY